MEFDFARSYVRVWVRTRVVDYVFPGMPLRDRLGADVEIDVLRMATRNLAAQRRFGLNLGMIGGPVLGLLSIPCYKRP
ncbi:hypothetical protein EAH80_28220 [Mycobacterium hodleri]|uniref:Uncharacterized protein n=1 Tax=Mycolicibacterium hodleri TaxID=49897 RepID=A0A502DS56_9MYCO|nr:hypothetical protein EAH80_28220 [Mycolicibacterium hodleri]